MSTEPVTLSFQLLIALRDCAEYARHRPYTWKPKSMEKLEALGMVEPDLLMSAGQVAYRVTEKGHKYLAVHA